MSGPLLLYRQRNRKTMQAAADGAPHRRLPAKTQTIRHARDRPPPPTLSLIHIFVAHELVHLLEPTHNQRFHALLDTYCPNNRALSQRLKKPPANEL